MIPTRFLTFLSAAFAFGCANNPPVQPAASSKSQFEGATYGGETIQLGKPTPGAEAYRAFYQGGSSFVSVSSVRGTVEQMATQQCARNGKIVKPLQETASKPPHVLGNFPRVEWLFECADPVRGGVTAPGDGDKLSRLERLKKLLDSGALTQQEYDREKAKILGTQ